MPRRPLASACCAAAFGLTLHANARSDRIRVDVAPAVAGVQRGAHQEVFLVLIDKLHIVAQS